MKIFHKTHFGRPGRGPRSAILAALFFTATLMAQTPYDEGQKALREQRWMDAAEQFEEAGNTGDQAEAASYWRAYALAKSGRVREAERQLQRLERDYPDSVWLNEAENLRLEYQHPDKVLASGQDGSGFNDEMKIFALSQLMERDPERALPLVLDLMNTTDSNSVRNSAVFILSMSDEPAAAEALVKMTDNSDPEVRRHAIHALSDSEDPQLMLAMLEKETDPELQVEIIHLLGMMDATAELKGLYPRLSGEAREAAIQAIAMGDSDAAAELLMQMYRESTDPEQKELILHSMGMLEDNSEFAAEIARTDPNPKMRLEAIHMLGVMEATDELAALYSSLPADDLPSRRAVIESLAIAEDADKLLAIYPSAGPGEKRIVVEAMLILDDASALIGLLEKESDPELRRAMIEVLSAMDSEEAENYLFSLLENQK